ncbi:hypothetical protein JCM8795_08060 [Hydrogenobaculum acidophilum]
MVLFRPIPIQAYEELKPEMYKVNVKVVPVSYYPMPKVKYSNPSNAIKNVGKGKEPETMIGTHFENTVFIKDKFLIKNIDYLYKMGYLPFTVKNYKDYKDGYRVILKWDAKTVPPKLVALSITSKNSILYKSAILRFMRDDDIKFNPNNTMLANIILNQAYKSGFKAKKPFVWVYVNQHIPQKVYVWENGKYVFESLANTGVMGTTNSGTYMVYLRFRKTAMKGTFPGTNKTYNDPDVPWVNYFYRGEALHGFPRRRYGYPQSAGCVELPIPKAKDLYKILYKYAVVTLSHYDKRYLATHPYKSVKNISTEQASFKPINPLRLGF